MKRQSTPCLLSDAFNICNGNSAVTSSAANSYVEVFIRYRLLGDRPSRSKFSIRENEGMYRKIFSATASRMYKALVKSTSETVLEMVLLEWVFFWKKRWVRMLYGNPIIVLQVTPWLITFLTCWRPARIQYLRHTRFSVKFAQAYNWLTCVTLMPEK